MTNLQQGASILSPRGLRRLWFGAPAAALGVLSLVMAAAVLLPLWQTLQRDNRRLRELEDLQVQVSLVRQQLRAQDLQQEKALQQRDKLLRMISGSGDVSTLLAVLDREAKEADVRLDLYEPQTGGPPPPAQAAPTPSGGGNPNQQPPPNPLETAGLQPQGMLISLRGRYPNLLNFLRRLESLSLLVIQSDLKLEAPPASTDPKRPAAQEVSMKLSLRVYGKPGGGEAQANPAAAATTPPTAPPAAPSPTGTTPPGAAPPTNPAKPPPPAPAAQPGSPPATPPAQPAQGGAPPATPQGSTAPPAANPPAAPRPAGR